MATVTETEKTSIRPIRRSAVDECVVMCGIDWGGYRRMLRIRGEQSRPRMIYLDGDLTLMSPRHPHEKDKERFGLFVPLVAAELRIPFVMAGSTTYRHRKKDGGIEPDQSYYLTNSRLIINKKEIDLRVDPPPDLSIEVVYSNSAKNAVEVSRRLRIPEVWVCTERRLSFLILAANGEYAESPNSVAFPFLSAIEVSEWIRRPLADDASDADWIFDLQRWVREVLVPRAANRGE